MAQVHGGPSLGVRTRRSPPVGHQTGDFFYGLHPQAQVRVAPPHPLTYLGGPTVDTSKISFGEMVAGASGLALFIFMFFPWYGLKTEVEGLGEVEGVNGNAWEVFSIIDILLLLVALLAVGMAVARAAGAMPADLPAPAGMIVALAGALALLLILFRLISAPDPDITGDAVDLSRKIGVFLGLIAAAGITFGGYTAMNERKGGHAPRA